MFTVKRRFCFFSISDQMACVTSTKLLGKQSNFVGLEEGKRACTVCWRPTANCIAPPTPPVSQGISHLISMDFTFFICNMKIIMPS